MKALPIFHNLQTLRDRESRALYDHQLSQAELQATVVLHDEIELEDMETIHEATDESIIVSGLVYMTYPCRCGDSYVLTMPDLQLAVQATRQIIIPCRCVGQVLGQLLL